MYVGEACIVWVITVVDLNYEHSLIEVGRKVIWFAYEGCLENPSLFLPLLLSLPPLSFLLFFFYSTCVVFLHRL